MVLLGWQLSKLPHEREHVPPLHSGDIAFSVARSYLVDRFLAHASVSASTAAQLQTAMEAVQLSSANITLAMIENRHAAINSTAMNRIEWIRNPRFSGAVEYSGTGFRSLIGRQCTTAQRQHENRRQRYRPSHYEWRVRTTSCLAVACCTMHRWLFTVCAVLSLLLCLCVVGVWCAMVMVFERHNLWVGTDRVIFTPTNVFILRPEDPTYTGYLHCKTSFIVGGLGFGYGSAYGVFVPYWFMIALLLVVPAVWWRQSKRLQRWAATGCCIKCGYDLRASKERCPECGTAISA